MSRLLPVSARCAELLRNPPGIGKGRHTWLFRVAACLHHSDYKPEKIRQFLLAIGEKYGWSDRMGKTLDDIFAKLDAGLAPGEYERLPPWPQVNDDARYARFSHPPMFNPDADAGVNTQEIIQHLFEPDQLMCVGWSKYSFTTAPARDLIENAHTAEFIVANPMVAETADNGSKRCKQIASKPEDRRFAVIEFDTGETKQEQAAVLSSLHGSRNPLVMAVWSGGKSIHAWFNVSNLSTYEKLYFYRFAVYLGADDTLFDMSKLVRMPGGKRNNGQHQGIIYWEPNNL